MMQFEIQFDEKLNREHSKMCFDIFWNKHLNKNKKKLYWGIPFILIGCLVVYGKSDLGYFYILIGCYYIFSYYQYWSYYNKNKKEFFQNVELNIKRSLDGNKIITWDFNDEFLKYSDNNLDLKIKWELFESYDCIKNTIFINVKNKIITTLMLSEEEIGKESFDKTIALIKEKINKHHG